MVTTVEMQTVNSAFDQKIDELVKYRNEAHSVDLGIRWRIGHIVMEVLDDPAKYGQHKLAGLSHRVDIDEQTLRYTQKFAKLYDEEGLARLVQHPHVGWSHVIQLLRLDDAKQRAHVEQALLNKADMSRDKLSRTVDKVLGKGPAQVRMRSLRSGNPGEALRTVNEEALHLFQSLGFVDEAVAKIDDVKDGGIKTEMTEQRTELVEVLKKLQAKLSETLASLERVECLTE